MNALRVIAWIVVSAIALWMVGQTLYPAWQYGQFAIEDDDIISLAGTLIVWVILLYVLRQPDESAQTENDGSKTFLYFVLVSGTIGLGFLIAYPEWRYEIDTASSDQRTFTESSSRGSELDSWRRGLMRSEPKLEFSRIALWNINEYRNPVWLLRNAAWIGGVLVLCITSLLIMWRSAPPPRIEKEPDPDWL